MPKLRRRALERRSGWNTPRTIERLLSGHDFDFLDGTRMDQPPLSEDELARAWQELGDRITRWHVAGGLPPEELNLPAGWFNLSRPQPGTRPWGWWMFTAPRPLPAGDWLGAIPPAEQLAYLRKHRLVSAAEERALAAR